MYLRLLAVILLAGCGLSVARADAITYMFTGSFSGSLGALTFNNATGTISMSGDTANVMSLGGGYYTNTQGLSTITIDGVGTALFLSPTFGVLSQFGGEGFFDINSGFGVSVYNGGTSSYDLSSAYSDSGYFLRSFAASFGGTELTSRGELSLTGEDNTMARFTATTAAATTPEPASLLLIATGVVGIAGAARRRFHSRRRPLQG